MVLLPKVTSESYVTRADLLAQRSDIGTEFITKLAHELYRMAFELRQIELAYEFQQAKMRDPYLSDFAAKAN